MAQRGRKHAAEAFLAVFACAATVEKTRPRPGWAEASLLAKILPLTSAWPKSRLRPSSVPAPCSALPVWKQAKHGATHRPANTAAVVRLEMRLRSRLERLERRLHAGADKLAMCQFFELLASALAGDELSPEACRQLEELEEQLLPLERRQLLEQIVRDLDKTVKTVEEMILEGLPTTAKDGLGSGDLPG
jgi:hypothetical protein